MPSAPASTARRASAPPSGPLTMSLPGQCARSTAMSSKVMLELNCPMLSATVLARWPGGKFANVIAGLRSIRTQYAGRLPMLAIVLTVSSGGMTSPLRMSRLRLPVTVVSTVTASTRYPLAAARWTRSWVSPRSLNTYSWNQMSSWPDARAAAARSSIEVVDMVDSVYGRLRRPAARATATSPSGCIIRVQPVGAMASGMESARPNNCVPVSTPATSTSSLGRNRHPRNARALPAMLSSSSAAPST